MDTDEMRRRFFFYLCSSVPRLWLILFVFLSPARAQISKGHRLLIEHGFQIQGMVTKDDVFHLETYQKANYTAINWLFQSDPAKHGKAPGFPWGRWCGNENEMPPI